MHARLLCAVLLSGTFAAWPTLAAAQFPPPPPPSQFPAPAPSGGPPPTLQDRWPEMPPATEQSPAPRQQQPAQRRPPSAAQGETGTAKPRPAPSNVVACSGVFARDSTHLKLATRFDSRNLVFTKVNGPEGSQLDASVVFPNDPRRRLEVLWNDNAARSETSMIAINGKSQWIAPKGLKLGMTLAALEKINGRPFRLSAIDKEGTASVIDWLGGSLAKVPGECKIGLRLAPDSKAPKSALGAVTGDRNLMSNDASLRPVKLTTAEIIIGY